MTRRTMIMNKMMHHRYQNSSQSERKHTITAKSEYHRISSSAPIKAANILNNNNTTILNTYPIKF